MYKGIKKLAELILESEEKFLTGQDEQEVVRTISSKELGTPLFLQKFLLNQSGRGNLLTVRVTDGSGDQSTVYIARRCAQ